MHARSATHMCLPERACTAVGCRCRQSGGRGPQERLTLAQLIVPKEDLPPADAKPQWHTLTATVAQIDPNQSMYYEACPDNNRKACCSLLDCPQLMMALLCPFDAATCEVKLDMHMMRSVLKDLLHLTQAPSPGPCRQGWVPF